MPFYPTIDHENQNLVKMWKSPGYIILLHMTIIWCMVSEIWGAMDIISGQSFFVILGHFLCFDPPNNPKNQKSKFWKKLLETSSFYIFVPQITIIWCMVPEISSATEKIFCDFGLFLPFYPTNNQKNQNFEKMKKNAWRYHHFTLVYHKWQSYEVWFLRYRARQT